MTRASFREALAPAILALENGTVFEGTGIGARGQSVGEIVFNTAMTGYQEILTDPSYAQQIVTLTYPHIGNVGVNPEDEEANRIFAAGLVIRSRPVPSSSWRSSEELSDYLARCDVVAIADIDTRELTRVLRTEGAQRGALYRGDDALEPAVQARALAAARAFPGLVGMDLAKTVSVSEPYGWTDRVWSLMPRVDKAPANGRPWRVIAYDFGIKRNILRLLVEHGCDVTVVPAETPAQTALEHAPDGIFLSNGPGDPEPCAYAVSAVQSFLERKIPVFGICLGHQVLSLASGAKTVKMKFGHHGANHPVKDLDTDAVVITSQNHGFAVDEQSLPNTMRATHRSLFDGSLQGVERLDVPAFGFQGHPEASPGPHDAAGLFEKFVALMAKHAAR